MHLYAGLFELHELRFFELSGSELPWKELGISLTKGQEVTCKLTGERSYERYVGVCTISGSDLAKSMIAAGMALDCARYSGGRYRQYELPKAREFLIQKGYCR